MKYLKKSAWGLLTGMLMLVGCQQDEWVYNERANPHKELIDGAREYFEQSIFEAATRGELVQEVRWSPGDVTPSWQNARVKKDKDFEYVMVPMYTQNTYVSEQRAVVNGGQRRYHSKVWQFLCVRKHEEDKYSAAYITLAPIKSYYLRHRNQVLDKFLDADSFHGDFTGHVIYNDIVNFHLMAVDKVKDGMLQWGFSRWATPNFETFIESYCKMFQDFSILRVVSTKSMMEVEHDDVDVRWCKNCNTSVDSSHSCGTDLGNLGDYYGGGRDPGDDFWNWDSGSNSDPNPGVGWGSNSGGGNNSGSGNNNNSGSSNETPAQKKAKKVFNYSNLDSSLQNKLITMVEQMMADCMASKLLDAMESRGISIGDDPYLSVNGAYNVPDNTIILKVWDDPSLLTHELLHVYQHANGGCYNEINGVNMEIEAKLAQYLFNKRNDPSKEEQYKINRENGNRTLFLMGKQLNSNSTIKKNAFWSYYEDYAKLIINSAPHYGYDSYNKGIDNIIRLSSGC